MSEVKQDAKNLSVFHEIVLNLGEAMEGLASLESEGEWEELLSHLHAGGISKPPLLTEIVAMAKVVTTDIDQLIDGGLQPRALITLGTKLWDFKDKVAKLDEVLPQPPNNFGETVLGYVLSRYLHQTYPVLEAFFVFLGVLDGRAIENDGHDFEDVSYLSVFQGPYKFYPNRVLLLLKNPESWAEKIYQWKTAFNGTKLIAHISFLMRSLGIQPGQYLLPGFENEQVEGTDRFNPELRIPLFRFGELPEDLGELGLALFPVPGGSHLKPGLVLTSYFIGTASETFDIGDNIQASFQSTLDLTDGFSVLFRPDVPPHFGFGNGSEISMEDSVGTFSIGVGSSNEFEQIWFGEQEGSHVGIRGWFARVSLEGNPLSPDLAIDVGVNPLFLVINTDEGDGFVKKLIPLKLDTKVPLALGWSSEKGFYFRGSGGLSVELRLNQTLGPINVRSFYITLLLGKDHEIGLECTASISFSLGPISGSLDRIGLLGTIEFASESTPPIFSGLKFRSPSGVGLTVKAAGVTGGGYLSFDKANHLYSGALQLQFAKVGLDAIGFITTGGPEGFSLVININARFTPPVQLSFGFTLVAVGGLIAINRTMAVEALQKGMLDRTLDSLLFPRNPVDQAPRIIQDLQRVLPAQDDRYVVGPMLRITWGAKSLVKIDLGLFFEFPNPVRMLLAGQLDVAVPHEEKPLIEFHAAILGLLDLGRKVLAIDTRIKEGSHIVGFEVLGDTALRLSWGEKPYFLLSMGGFHPKFPVPAAYPALPQPFRRLSLIFDELKFFHLSCESYFAITSNSLQFGANANLYVKLSKRLKVEGYLGYDTLIMFSPFFFEVGIRAGVAVKWKKRTLVGVALEFTLSGPRPWRAKGKGKIKILFIKISIGFDVSWGKKDPVPLDAINPMTVLQEALEAPDSWGSLLPPHQLMGEALDPLERLLVTASPDDSSPDTPSLVMHPAGTLEIRQKAMPLGIRLDTLQNAPVTTADRVVIDQVTVGDQVFHDPALVTTNASNPVFTSVEEHFAHCQFATCPVDARLTKPAFELMDAGAAITSGTVTATAPAKYNEAASLDYESLVIDDDLTAVRGEAQPARVMQLAVGKDQWLGNAATSRARRAIRPFQSTAGNAPKRRVRLAPPAYHVVEYVEATGSFKPMKAEALRPYRTGRMRPLTRLEADQVVSAIYQQHPDQNGRYSVLPETEVVP